MMIIDELAMNEEDCREWCRFLAYNNTVAGGFLTSFAEACLKADGFNFRILQPAIETFMEKYPQYMRMCFRPKNEVN